MVDLRDVSDGMIFGIAIFGVSIALFGAFKGWYGPGLTSAIASSGLVIATTLSLITTRETLREQRLSREQEAKPLLRIVFFQVIGGKSLMVENIGNGPAKEIDINLKAVPTAERDSIPQETIEITLPTIAPGESVAVSRGLEEVLDPSQRQRMSEEELEERGFGVLGLTDNVTKEDLEDAKKVVMQGSCRDILDNEHSIHSEYHTKYLEEGFAQYGSFDTDEQLSEIAQHMKNIESQLRDFSRSL